MKYSIKTAWLASCVLVAATVAGALSSAGAPPRASAHTKPHRATAHTASSKASKPATTKAAAEPSVKPLPVTTDSMPKLPMVKAKDRTSWILPIFKTTVPVNKQITTVVHYPYREMSYAPAVTVNDAVVPAEQHVDSPEDVFIARASDMMRLDYVSWLDTWDPASKLETIAYSQHKNASPEFKLKQWGGVFRSVRLQMVRRIETGPFVIVSYAMAVQGKRAGPYEFPTVFQPVKGTWYATQDLHSDPLLINMPWLGKTDHLEIDVRPIQQFDKQAPAVKSAAATTAKSESKSK